MDRPDLDALHRQVMDRVQETKTWTTPKHNGHGPVRMTLRLPDVSITDSEGRSIMISPSQAALLGGWMSETIDWIVDLDVES